MWLYAALVATALVAVAAKVDDTAIRLANASDLINRNPCCAGDNIDGESCVETNSSITCDVYKLEHPFFINENKNLVYNSNIIYEAFCTTHAWNDTHLQEVALVCFPEEKAASMFLIKGSMAMVSVIFILATLYVYYLIPELRESQDKVTCVALSCMMMFLLCLGIMQLYPNFSFCHTIGLTTYFFSMAYFTWLNLIMLNVLKTSVFYRWQIQERTWYILNHVYGWVVPIVLLVNLIIQKDLHFGAQTCWINRGRSIWLFLYMPMLLMLILNVVLFVWSGWAIHMSGQDVSPDRKRALAYKLRLYVKLVFLAGFTWILELLSTYFDETPDHKFSLWILVDAINALLGVFVFLVLVVWRPRIRRELAGKRILCFRSPSSWADGAISDDDNLNQADHEILKTNGAI